MTLSVDALKPQNSAPPGRYDVVVVGAGPYGLSTAAHLLGKGLRVAVFGRPISFWQEHMPEGMLLRSFWWASNLSDPQKAFGVGRYLQEQGREIKDPLSLETFIQYGQWFQQHAVPQLDQTYVATVERKGEQFEVKLEDGRTIETQAVVMAPGLLHYVYYPEEYKQLAPELVSHPCDHRTLKHFAGKRVVIVGGGQSALETAALLHEMDVDVQIISRRPIFWLPAENPDIPFFIRQLRSPKVGLGYGWINLALEKYPYVFSRLPRATKDRMVSTFHGPAGASWLRERVVGKIPLYERQQIEKVEEADSKVYVTISSGKKFEADHIILATGYRADVSRLPMLHPSLLGSLQTYMGSPSLNSHFESNVPGLYFIGFSAARSAGPLYRFVVGAQAAARSVAAAVAQRQAGIRR